MNLQTNRSIKNYICLFGAFFIYSVSELSAKLAAGQESAGKMLIFMALEFLLLEIYALIWQQLLKKFQLSTAMSCKGITVLYAMGWSAFLFGETITIRNMLGAALVMIGIGVVASDG